MSIPSGVVYLCKNAIVDRNYTHTIDFKTPSEQLAYWGFLVKYRLDNYSYIRRNSQSIKVDKTMDELQDVNYLYYRAEENSKMYFCFVTNKEYINDNTTQIFFETDVLQTRMFEYEVKQSYVLQEHTDRWDANHKPIYSRTDEGLDYGSEYTIENAYKVRQGTDTPIQWFLAICKPGSVSEASGRNTTEVDRVGAVSPYIYYLLPEVTTDIDYYEGYVTKYVDTAGTQQLGTIYGLNEFIYAMAHSSLGNYVQQIVKIPYLPINVRRETSYGSIHLDLTIPFTSSGNRWADTVQCDITTIQVGTAVVTPVTSNFLRLTRFGTNEGCLFQKLASMSWDEGIQDALPTAEQWAEVKANPYSTPRDKRFESKLLTHPYRYNLFTDWKGSPVIIKNEYMTGDKIQVNYTQSLSFNSPARYWIDGYKKDPEGQGSSLVQLIPEEAPIVTDAYYTYLLNNKNQIQANQTNAIINASVNTVQSAVMGGIHGGPIGALLGGATAGISGAVSYQNMIRSENAKQKDLKNLPDTIVNPNDANFSVFNDNEYISFYRMKICCEFEELLADTFAMTGYVVKRVKIPNLRTRTRYNYVKTIGANIVGSFDQEDLSTIRNIFDNGVTFWHYNNVNFKPLDYSLENIEVNLI